MMLSSSVSLDSGSRLPSHVFIYSSVTSLPYLFSPFSFSALLSLSNVYEFMLVVFQTLIQSFHHLLPSAKTARPQLQGCLYLKRKYSFKMSPHCQDHFFNFLVHKAIMFSLWLTNEHRTREEKYSFSPLTIMPFHKNCVRTGDNTYRLFKVMTWYHCY